jgi:hypothetical protein
VSIDLLAPAFKASADNGGVSSRKLRTECLLVKGGMGGTTVTRLPRNANPASTKNPTNAGCAQRARALRAPTADPQRSDHDGATPMRVERSENRAGIAGPQRREHHHDLHARPQDRCWHDDESAGRHRGMTLWSLPFDLRPCAYRSAADGRLSGISRSATHTCA